MSTLHRRALLSLTAGAGLLAAGCANTASTTSTATTPAAPALQGTGDLGVVIERAWAHSRWSIPPRAKPLAGSRVWETYRTHPSYFRAMAAMLLFLAAMVPPPGWTSWRKKLPTA